MTNNERVSDIYSKLMEFQMLGVSIKKDANNPHFKSKYADLSEVIGKVRPELTKVGIVFMQVPDDTGLTTIFYDTESKTQVSCHLPYIGATDPQKLGSNLTYLRRYSLVTMLGLEDDDDDGNKASAPVVQAKAVPAKSNITPAQAFAILRKSITIPELEATYKLLPASLRGDAEVIAVAGEVKKHILNSEEPVIVTD